MLVEEGIKLCQAAEWKERDFWFICARLLVEEVPHLLRQLLIRAWNRKYPPFQYDSNREGAFGYNLVQGCEYKYSLASQLMEYHSRTGPCLVLSHPALCQNNYAGSAAYTIESDGYFVAGRLTTDQQSRRWILEPTTWPWRDSSGCTYTPSSLQFNGPQEDLRAAKLEHCKALHLSGSISKWDNTALLFFLGPYSAHGLVQDRRLQATLYSGQNLPGGLESIRTIRNTAFAHTPALQMSANDLCRHIQSMQSFIAEMARCFPEMGGCALNFDLRVLELLQQKPTGYWSAERLSVLEQEQRDFCVRLAHVEEEQFGVKRRLDEVEARYADTSSSLSQLYSFTRFSTSKVWQELGQLCSVVKAARH